MKPRTSLHAVLSVVAISAAACGGGDDPHAPADLRLHDFLIAVDVTPDGATAAFEDLSTADVRLILVDTATGDATDVTSVGDPSFDLATGIADTGAVTAMHGQPVEAGVWTAADDWTDLGSPHDTGCDPQVAGAWDISADGSVIVGMAWNGCDGDAFRWTEAGGFTSLTVLGEDFEGGVATNRATVVSDDGAVVAGFAEQPMRDRAPAAWLADGSAVMLSEDSDLPGEVLSISADGSVMAGNLAADGFVWTEADGLVILPRPEISLPTDPMFPNAMTGDGSAVFGAVGDAFFGTPMAFVWTEADGARLVADVAAAAGIEIPEGLILGNVLGASADGTVLIGTALDATFATKSFVLRLPRDAY